MSCVVKHFIRLAMKRMLIKIRRFRHCFSLLLYKKTKPIELLINEQRLLKTNKDINAVWRDICSLLSMIYYDRIEDKT
jgi:hypothetical protein